MENEITAFTIAGIIMLASRKWVEGLIENLLSKSSKEEVKKYFIITLLAVAFLASYMASPSDPVTQKKHDKMRNK